MPDDVTMHRVPDDALPLGHAPGAFAWRTVQAAGLDTTHRRLAMVLPGGVFVMLPVQRAGEPAPVGIGEAFWTWDGDEDAPTLTPSVFVNPPTGWHGFITAGVMRGC